MNSNSNIQIFNYEGNTVRTVEQDGETWFVAKDIANVLGYQRTADAVAAHISSEDKGVGVLPTPGGKQEMIIINEAGIYALIFGSKLESAKQFKHWVTHEVLPQIRRTGFYATPATAEQIIANPDTFIEILKAYKSEKERAAALEAETKALQAQAEQDKPKVLFAESVTANDNSILIRDLAKLLRQNGYITGEKRLFAELRELGFLIKCGSSYNMPTQKSMDMGLMEIIERTINRGVGNIIVSRTPKITGKGQVYFINMFLNQEAKSCAQN